MDVIKTGLKNTFKILAVIAPVYWFVVDPIVNDWEDTVIYNAFFKPAPVVDESKDRNCSDSSLIGLACKGIEGLSNLADEIKEKTEATEMSRANPENQYDSLQECLGDDTKMVEYTTRDGWCNSRYVLIKG